jgi:hypothetical protein
MKSIYYRILHYFIHFYFITMFEIFFYIYYIFPYEKSVLSNAIQPPFSIDNYNKTEIDNYKPVHDLLKTCDSIIQKDTNKIDSNNNGLIHDCYIYIYMMNAFLVCLFLYDLYITNHQFVIHLQEENTIVYNDIIQTNNNSIIEINELRHSEQKLEIELNPIPTQNPNKNSHYFIIYFFKNSFFMKELRKVIIFMSLLCIFEYVFFTYIVCQFKFLSVNSILCMIFEST